MNTSKLNSIQTTIKVNMYLRPIIYEDFWSVCDQNLNLSDAVLGSVIYDDTKKRYVTDVNPERLINGPLSEYGQQLENPVKGEYNEFKKDCVWLVKELGFTVIKQYTSLDSKKSEYVVMFGLDDDPCGTLVYDLRISDHPFDATFPEELKDEAVEYLKMNNVLDGSATKAGIDFEVEKITVGTVRSDTWDKAFNRLYIKLNQMRNAIRVRQKIRNR